MNIIADSKTESTITV